MGDRHERLFLLAIQRIFNSSPRVGRRLLQACGSAGAVFQAPECEIRPLFGRAAELWEAFAAFKRFRELEASLDSIEGLGGELLSIVDGGYPPLLAAVEDAPPVLTLIGRREALGMPGCAIVGARKASRHGLQVAAEMGEGLAAMGFAVISGMAYGIDAAAHRGALAAGGTTVAVWGCGPDIVHPPSHRRLAADIKDSGLVVTEFPVGEMPYPGNFPQRNRVISGLAVGAVIVEAEPRSGSLITARLALRQGREVMAVPGPAGTQLALGTNGLIRDGGWLVECPEDVFQVLQPAVRTMGFSERAGHLKNDVDKDSQIFRALSSEHAAGFDELIRATGMSVKEISNELLRLKLAGRVDEMPGRRWRLRKTDA